MSLEFPDELTRAILEYLLPEQRLAVARVCRLWHFLGATFPSLAPLSATETAALQCLEPPLSGGTLVLSLVDNAEKLRAQMEGTLLNSVRPIAIVTLTFEGGATETYHIQNSQNLSLPERAVTAVSWYFVDANQDIEPAK